MANGAAGTLFAWSVLLRPVGADLGVPADSLGSVFAVALASFAVSMLLGGGAVDRHGPRRTTALAGLLAGTGLVVAASAPDLLLLHLGYGVLFGLGSGLTYLSTVTWAGTRPGGHRAVATSVVVAAFAAGPVVAAPAAAWAIDRWGWRPALLGWGIVVATAALAGARGLPRSSLTGPPKAPAGAAGDPVALVALWVLFLTTVSPGLLAFAYAAEVAGERGLSGTAAALVVSGMAAGNLAGRLLAAPLTHLGGVVTPLWIVLALLVPALGLLGSSVPAGIAVMALVVVAGQYGLVSATLPLATWRVSGDERFATAYGRVFSSFGVAGLGAPALGAWLHAGDAYAAAFRALLVAVAVATVALLVYRRRTPG